MNGLTASLDRNQTSNKSTTTVCQPVKLIARWILA
jgi:hypothetical protein